MCISSTFHFSATHLWCKPPCASWAVSGWGEEKEGKERGRSRGLLSSLQESHGQNCHPHDTAKALARMALIHNSSVCPNSLFVAPAYMPLIGLHKAPNSLQAPFFSPLIFSLPTNPLALFSAIAYYWIRGGVSLNPNSSANSFHFLAMSSNFIPSPTGASQVM